MKMNTLYCSAFIRLSAYLNAVLLVACLFSACKESPLEKITIPICEKSLCLLAPSGGETYSIGDTMMISAATTYEESFLCDALKEISFDFGQNYILLDVNTIVNSKCTKFTWIIPDSLTYFDHHNNTIKKKATISDSCILRISGYNRGDITDETAIRFNIKKSQ